MSYEICKDSDNELFHMFLVDGVRGRTLGTLLPQGAVMSAAIATDWNIQYNVLIKDNEQ